MEVLSTGEHTQTLKPLEVLQQVRGTAIIAKRKDIINKSILNYSKYAKHIYITEGRNIGAEQVKEL